jgi:hypothetical protein
MVCSVPAKVIESRDINSTVHRMINHALFIGVPGKHDYYFPLDCMPSESWSPTLFLQRNIRFLLSSWVALDSAWTRLIQEHCKANVLSPTSDMKKRFQVCSDGRVCESMNRVCWWRRSLLFWTQDLASALRNELFIVKSSYFILLMKFRKSSTAWVYLRRKSNNTALHGKELCMSLPGTIGEWRWWWGKRQLAAQTTNSGRRRDSAFPEEGTTPESPSVLSYKKKTPSVMILLANASRELCTKIAPQGSSRIPQVKSLLPRWAYLTCWTSDIALPCSFKMRILMMFTRNATFTCKKK